MSAEWRFRIMGRDEQNVDPVHDAFFSVNSIENLTDALVRETIQNSLDASLGATRVHVSFSFHSLPFGNDLFERYFNVLPAHIKSVATENYAILDNKAGFLPALIIEDFGTRGLCGNPQQYEDDESAPGGKNDFYYFWRNVGRSVKADEDRGRWGLGKVVFPVASTLNSFFGLTERADDGREMLMGQSVIKIHQLNGEKFAPYGYYGEFEERDAFAMPVCDDESLAAFRKHFKLSRNGEPGLSIAIPHPREEITAAELVKSAVHQYFYPILARQLTIEIVDSRQKIELNHETIKTCMESAEGVHGRSPECMRRLFDLSLWSLALPETEHISIPALPPNESPSWNKVELGKELTETLKAAFEKGSKIALRIPLKVEKTNEDPVQSFFDVYLQQDKEAEAREEFFIRQGITIPGIWSYKDTGVRGLVVIKDGPLSALLGDAENPAHTDWQQRSPKFGAKYKHGSSCVGFVKKSLNEIIRKLSEAPRGRDADLLRDLFFIEKEVLNNPGADKTAAAARGKGPSGGDIPKFPERTPMVQISRLAGGFSVGRHPDAVDTPVSITIDVAYETRRGNPFKQYNPNDFEMDKPPLEIRADNVELASYARNRLELNITGNDFKIWVRGFDPNRDLRTRVVPLRPQHDT